MKNWGLWGFLLSVTIAAALQMQNSWQSQFLRLIAWGVVTIGVVLVVATIPSDNKPTLRTALLDSRNRYSLPNLITVCWFVTIVSAYLSTALGNIHLWDPSKTNSLPISIIVPNSIWVLAGIVGVSVVGTNIIISEKMKSTGSGVYKPATTADAKMSDLVTYDEDSVRDKTDLAALQQLLFQIVAVIVYVVALGRLMVSTGPAKTITEFPVIPEGFLALLGVSTLTALANRAIPR
jgi:hypothetical protein